MHKDQKHKIKIVLTLCPKCNKSFSSLASMQQHYEMKHKLKEFHCDIGDCDYFSNSQEQLDHHSAETIVQHLNLGVLNAILFQSPLQN